MTKLHESINLGKRRSVKNIKECQYELKDVLPRLFRAFNRAVTLYNKEIVFTPKISRGRGFEANYLNSKIVQCIQDEFPDDCFWGKYKRFILRKDGYIVLFKKLNKMNLPMNVQTKNATAIENQVQKSLFDDQEDVFEPIVFLGYRKNSFGEISAPKLVYIDEGLCKFEITENDLEKESSVLENIISLDSKPAASMTLKPEVIRKKKSIGDA